MSIALLLFASYLPWEFKPKDIPSPKPIMRRYDNAILYGWEIRNPIRVGFSIAGVCVHGEKTTMFGRTVSEKPTVIALVVWRLEPGIQEYPWALVFSMKGVRVQR
jgi:hypothetical protein